MMKYIKIVKTLLALAIVAFLTACGHTSAIYNPTLNLPTKPLEAGEISISGNASLAPEAAPHRIDRTTSPAANASLKVGVIDKLAFQMEAWADVSDNNFFERGGYAFSAIYRLSDSDNDLVWALIPKYGFTLEEKVIESGAQITGHGLSLALVAWKKSNSSICKPYFGLNTMYGFMDWDHEAFVNPDGDLRSRSGFALSLNGGINFEILKWLNLNAEIPLVYHYNNFYNVHYLIPSASLGLNVDLQLSSGK